jgi:predicted transcriptional regulator
VKKIVSVFRPHNQGLSKLFGSLEADIIELIWQQREASARDIFEALRDQGQRLSYGAVKTVLDRLVKKQVLVRVMNSSHQYVYHALLDREEFTTSAVREIINSLVASFGDPVYAHFLEQIKEADTEQFERLTKMLDEAEKRKNHS